MWRSLALILCLAVGGPSLAAELPRESSTPAEDEPAVSAAALADVLEDEAARQRLIEELRRLAAGEQDPTGGATTSAGAPPLPDRIGAFTQGIAGQAVEQFGQAVDALRSIDDTTAADWEAVGEAALGLGVLAFATLAAYFLLRRLDRLAFWRIAAWARRTTATASPIRWALAVVCAAGIDGAAVALAWAAGWASALAVGGQAGAIDPHLALFLNAFLVVEGSKVVLRAIFGSRWDGLRFVPLGEEEAAYWYAWLAHLVSFVGYGTLLIVPVISAQLSPALGQLTYVLVVSFGLAYAVSVLLQNRARVRGRLERISQRASSGSVRIASAAIARVWHAVAIAYFTTLAVMLLTRPDEALAFMGVATAQTLLAIGLGGLVSAVLGRAISRGIRAPEATRAKFPQLDTRLNAFVPRGLQAIRAVIVILVIAVLLDAWRLFDLGAWLASDAGVQTLSSALSVAVILLLAAVGWIVLASWIDYVLSTDPGTDMNNARQRTLLALFRNAAAVVIITVSVMVVLSELGINIGPLIAGAGVLGLAVGFGAQKLVQDIIGGVFIQLEKAINTGDWVTAGGISGEAERISIRSVGLRDLAGTFHVVPFSSVDTVSNYMRDFAYHVGVYRVAYGENTDRVIPLLIAAFEELRDAPEHGRQILGDIEISGITELAESYVNVRVRIKTRPGMQWMVGRAYNRLVKQHFETAGIEIPFPHRTLYFGAEKGEAAAKAGAHGLTDARQDDADS